jgi:UrcA family protein
MKESKLYKGLMATIIVVALGAPAIASADAKSELQGVSVKVSYADLNLEKQEGAKALYRRVQQASKQVCAWGRNLTIEASVRNMRDARQCYRQALSEAVAEIDNELVTQIHNS